jgi:hypothetical protein
MARSGNCSIRLSDLITSGHIDATAVIKDPTTLQRMCPPAKRRALQVATSTAAAIAASMKIEDEEAARSVSYTGWSMTIDDMVSATGKSRRWLFKHRTLPFIRSISRKTIIGDEAILKRWVESCRT